MAKLLVNYEQIATGVNFLLTGKVRVRVRASVWFVVRVVVRVSFRVSLMLI